MFGSFYIHFARGAKSDHNLCSRGRADVAELRVGNRKERDNFGVARQPNMRTRRLSSYGSRSRQLARRRVSPSRCARIDRNRGLVQRSRSEDGNSQSAISGQIATLERLIGVRLVKRIRGSRKVTLTLEGERLLDHA